MIDLKQQEWLVKQVRIPCLHVGCGQKPIPGAINIDPNPDRAPWIDFAYDVHDLPYEISTFESIVSSHVLNALRDIDVAMREMIRVLKPGGIMAHVIPDWSIAPKRCWTQHPWDYQHQGWYSVDEMRAFFGQYAGDLEVQVCELFPSFHWSFRVKALRL